MPIAAHYPLAEADAFISLARYRTLTGDQDASDEAISAALARYQALANGYTGRRLALGECSEQQRVDGETVQLRNWPLVEIIGINDRQGHALSTSDIWINTDTATLHHDGAWRGRVLTIAYEAGYRAAPDDLAAALCTLAASYLAGESGGQIDAVKRETVYGVYSIDYAQPKDAEAYPELGQWRAVLDRYRKPGFA